MHSTHLSKLIQYYGIWILRRAVAVIPGINQIMAFSGTKEMKSEH